MPLPLIGTRVQLRCFRPDDVKDVFAFASDPHVSRFVEWEPHRSPQESAAYIRRCLEPNRRCLTLAVELREAHRVVGTVDVRVVSWLRRRGEIGYTIARPYWGTGINIEAGRLLLDYSFRELHLWRILAACDVANRRSYRTMEKLGMARNRRIARARLEGGTPIDRYEYSISWWQWRRQRQYGRAPAATTADGGIRLTSP